MRGVMVFNLLVSTMESVHWHRRRPCRLTPRQRRRGSRHVTYAILSPLHLELESEGGEAGQPSGEVTVKNGYRISRRPP